MPSVGDRYLCTRQAVGYSDAVVEPLEKLIRHRQAIHDEWLSDDTTQIAELVREHSMRA